jgi:hypothetical protein
MAHISSGEIKAFLCSLNFWYLSEVRDVASFVSFYPEECDISKLER